MKAPIHEVILSLGSNIDPDHNLHLALLLLRETMEVKAIAQVWETAPVGTKGANFYNSAILSLTDLFPQELKTRVLRPIEQKMGRVRSSDKYAPRPIDLDIVLFDGQVVDDRLWSLAYLAIPISELIPEYQDIKSGKTLAEVARDLRRNNRAILHREVFPSI
ncbi:MAG: 2-amino-4-hydroxy-6-hydroxymethyldihydropteridine diphosphokinase [Chloroflexi bacterium]|nr:2-amino-4-hydroxy-6-hydroxymethyldihydropteridine diphosphokinase [Chloroflexota bacterium]